MQHKKKLMFLGGVTSVLQYYGMFYRFSAWLKSWEPFQHKLQRWVLDIPNLKPISILESEFNIDVKRSSSNWVYKGVSISDNQHSRLAKEFMDTDNCFFYGITFRFLFNLLTNLNALESTPETEKAFYDKSEYKRAINRKCCGMTLKEFASLIAEYKPVDTPVEDWVESVIREMGTLKDHHLSWEKRYIPLRMELIKMFSSVKNQKKEFISNLLIDNPFIRIEELGRDCVFGPAIFIKFVNGVIVREGGILEEL